MASIQKLIVKGYTYYRLVESYRDGGKVKQRVIKYLGKIAPSNLQHLEGDCLELLTTLPDTSVDVLLTDPPYSVMDDYEWDRKDLVFYDEWLSLLKPKMKLKHSGFIFCDSRRQSAFEGIIERYFSVKNRIIWVRKNMSLGRVIKDKFISSYEVILYFGNRELNLPKDWGAERFDSCEFAVPQSNFKDKKVHPTQKPLDLIKQLVRTGSYEGDTILDCFAGSGVVGLACREIGGRQCILMEQDAGYNTLIRERLNVV